LQLGDKIDLREAVAGVHFFLFSVYSTVFRYDAGFLPRYQSITMNATTPAADQ
jgi:hypothetical protein